MRQLKLASFHTHVTFRKIYLCSHWGSQGTFFWLRSFSAITSWVCHPEIQRGSCGFVGPVVTPCFYLHHLGLHPWYFTLCWPKVPLWPWNNFFITFRCVWVWCAQLHRTMLVCVQGRFCNANWSHKAIFWSHGMLGLEQCISTKALPSKWIKKVFHICHHGESQNANVILGRGRISFSTFTVVHKKRKQIFGWDVTNSEDWSLMQSTGEFRSVLVWCTFG